MITALVILLLLLAGDLFSGFALLLFVWYHQRRDGHTKQEEGESGAKLDPSLGCLMALCLAGVVLLLFLAWQLWPLI